MPRPSNKKQRRAQIARGLMEVMAKQGYDGAPLVEVAKAADLTTGLIHYHFKNKQEILIHLLRDIYGQHVQGLEKELARHDNDPHGQLGVFIDFHLGLGAGANPEALACWIVISGEALRQEGVRVEFDKAVGGFIDLLAGIITEGVNRGQFHCDSPASAACALMASIQGYFVLAAAARDRIPRGSAAKCTKEMANGLLRPAKPL